MFAAFSSFFLVFNLLFGSFDGQMTNTAAVKKTSLDFPKEENQLPLIKISVLDSAAEITVSTDGPFRVKDGAGYALFHGDKLNPTLLQAQPTGVQFGPQIFKRMPLIIESDGGLKIGKTTYRHALEIWNEKNKTLSVINEIKIEDYIQGVLPHEVNPHWGMEALKAQAVASRTYALFKAIENKDNRFALSKNVLSQVYGGKNSEHELTNQAVKLTRGQVLTYKGKIFPGYFHSTCGGTTTRADYNWSVEEHPSLKGVKCDFCRESKHFRWTAEMSLKEMEKALKKQGLSVFGLKKIATADIDESGRARNFLITDSKGKKKLPANDLRVWVDPFKLKSTLISSIDITGDKAMIRGKGWGHGVGLCQYGIKKLAELGYSYENILEHYYPRSEIFTVIPEETPSVTEKILNPIKETIKEYL